MTDRQTDRHWEGISFIITVWLQNLKNKYRRTRTLVPIFAGSANDNHPKRAVDCSIRL